MCEKHSLLVIKIKSNQAVVATFSKLPQRCGNNHDLQVLVCAIAVRTLLTQTNGMSSIVDIRET